MDGLLMDTINLAQARQLLRQAVETQGRDFVYNDSPNMCFNVPFTDDLVDEDGNAYQFAPPADHVKRRTGCLVGTAMTLAGRSFRPGFAAGTVGDAYRHHLSESALAYLRAAQNAQDQGRTWGEAFDDAEACAEAYLPAEAGAL